MKADSYVHVPQFLSIMELILQLLECLAIITFVGGNNQDETEKTMQIMWQVVHSKLGSNVSTSLHLVS